MTGGKQAVALEASNGRIAWQQSSNTTGTGILGAGTPAISGNIVILPYSSGEFRVFLLIMGYKFGATL